MADEKKLVLHSYKPLSAKEANTIRVVVPDDTLEELKELKERTGCAMSQLCRMLIEYALPRTEVDD